MRPSTLSGLILLIAGIIVLVQGGTFTTRRDVLDVGGIKLIATEQHPVQPWLAGAAILAGALIVAQGLRTKRA